MKNFQGANLSDHLKRAAFSQLDLQFTVWVLVSWPRLACLLPQEGAPHIIRICALLARRPSAGQLIPIMLQIPPETIYPLLDFLYMGGYICSIGDMQKQEQAALSHADAEVCAEASSFVSKAWHKLLDKWRP